MTKPKTYFGIVQKGTQRAATLGFPTVNIPLPSGHVAGIYVAKVIVDKKTYPAAAFADETRRVLEAHILDARCEMYGKEVTIELVEKIRDTMPFDNDGALRAAIVADIQKVRAYFSRRVI